MKLVKISIALLCLLATATLAKPSLPIQLSSRSLGSESAAVRVTFTRDARDVTLIVSSTGSAHMEPVTRRLARVAAGQTVEFAPVRTNPDSLGGVAVHLTGTIDEQPRTGVTTLTLTRAPGSATGVRAKGDAGGSSGGVILLPSKTTVRPPQR
jgi:hypothetical protein